MSRAKAIDAIEELSAWGLIHVETRQGDDKVFRSNLATLLDASQWRQSVDYVRGRDKTRIVKALETVPTPVVYDVHQGSIPDTLPPSVPGTPEQDPSPSEQDPGDQNPSSAGATPAQISDDPGQRQVVQTLNDDDDGSPFSIPEPEFPPDPEVPEITHKDAALRLLAEVAPNFDQPESWIETQDVVKVGLIAASLLADPGKQRRLKNSAGFVRAQARNGFQPDDKALAIWEKALAGADLDEDDQAGAWKYMVLEDGTLQPLEFIDGQLVVLPAFLQPQQPDPDPDPDPATAFWRMAQAGLSFYAIPTDITDRLVPVSLDDDVLTLSTTHQEIFDLCELRWKNRFRAALKVEVAFVLVDQDGTEVETTPAISDAPVEETTVETVPVDPATVVWRKALGVLQNRLLNFELGLVRTLTPLSFDDATRTLTLAVPGDFVMTQIEKSRSSWTGETWSVDGRLRQALDDVQVAYAIPETIPNR